MSILIGDKHVYRVRGTMLQLDTLIHNADFLQDPHNHVFTCKDEVMLLVYGRPGQRYVLIPPWSGCTLADLQPEYSRAYYTVDHFRCFLCSRLDVLPFTNAPLF